MRADGASLRVIADAVSRDGMPISHTGVRVVIEQETARVAAE